MEERVRRIQEGNESLEEDDLLNWVLKHSNNEANSWLDSQLALRWPWNFVGSHSSSHLLLTRLSSSYTTVKGKQVQPWCHVEYYLLTLFWPCSASYTYPPWLKILLVIISFLIFAKKIIGRTQRNCQSQKASRGSWTHLGWLQTNGIYSLCKWHDNKWIMAVYLSLFISSSNYYLMNKLVVSNIIWDDEAV